MLCPGYQACRMLAATTAVAEVVGKGVQASLAPDAMAAQAYATMWNRQNRLQRDFQVKNRHSCPLHAFRPCVPSTRSTSLPQIRCVGNQTV